MAKILYHIPMGVVGGAETHIQYLVRYLPRGMQAYISCEYIDTMPFAELICPGYVYYTPSPNSIAKLIKEQGIDLVQYYHSPTMYRAISKLHKTPKVVEVVHNRHFFQGDSSGYPKDFTDCVVAVSPDAKNYFLAQISRSEPTVESQIFRSVPDTMPPVRAEVIPNGIDHTRFYPIKRAPRTGRLVGGFTGRLETDGGKGVGLILEIAEASPNVSFELVGLDYGGHFKEEVKKRGIRNIQVFPHTDYVEEYYRKWDFFISMSPSEGFGISIAEALACGLPSIVKQCGGICNYLENNKHAYIINGVPDAIELLKDPKNIREHTLVPCEVDFSAKTMASKYVSLYEELLGKKKGAPLPTTASFQNTPKPTRVTSGMILGVSPQGWFGIRNALTNLCDLWCSTENAIDIIRMHNPSVVVFGSYRPGLNNIRMAAVESGAKTVLTWHGTHTFNEFSDEDRRLMAYALTVLREGMFDFAATPHKATAETWTRCGVPTDYLPNLLSKHLFSMAKEVTPPGRKIGILGTGFPWKNMETQIIAANFVEKREIFVQSVHSDFVLKSLGINDIKTIKQIWGNSYYDMLKTLDVNLSVGVTESFGYYAAESMVLGVPVVTSSMVSFMRDWDALRGCIAETIDDPFCILDKINYIYDRYYAIVSAGKSAMQSLQAKNQTTVDAIKEKWLV